jgi:predicted nucleic acid-binding protein
MKKVLLDSDVVIDYVVKRQPFDIEALEIFRLLARGKFSGYITSITPINVFYIGRKIKGAEDARRAIKRLLDILEVLTADKDLLRNSLSSKITDYEDAVQHACAEAANLDAIVTRNLSDYKNATLPVYSPPEFLNLLKTQ